jgi:hypothetical protein
MELGSVGTKFGRSWPNFGGFGPYKRAHARNIYIWWIITCSVGSKWSQLAYIEQKPTKKNASVENIATGVSARACTHQHTCARTATVCWREPCNPTIIHTQEQRACSTLSGRACFSREFGHRNKQAEKLQVSTLSLKGAAKGLQKSAGANTLIISLYMHRKQGVYNYVSGCTSFSGESGYKHKQDENVRLCTHSLKRSQWMAPKLF